MRKLTAYLIAAGIVCVGAWATTAAETASQQDAGPMRVYQVNKNVSEFPEKEDLTTPEAAYAAINRLMASGKQGGWRSISVNSLAQRLPPPDAKPVQVRPEDAATWLNAQVLEVRIFRGTRAMVVAQITTSSKKTRLDGRIVELEGGRWLNGGQGLYSTVDEARETFAASCVQFVERPARPKIEDPAAYLKPFVAFLKTKGEAPRGFLMKSLAEHKLVIMGEIHHRPRYWAFNCSLVLDPDFPKTVGTIYMELPSNDQALVERFLASEKPDTTPVIEMLRDNLWMGWPDQAMLEFFQTVWKVNQPLPDGRKLRVVLVDMQRPWKDIQKRQDWRKYNVDRDHFMAANVLRDMNEHPQDKRNSLFIVGVGHTMLDLRYFDGTPVTSAGWHLRKALGAEAVCAIFPHTCVMTNWGRVDGRLCLGLFDSAFAAIDCKPIAFPLSEGPFGEQPFDAFPERPVHSAYHDGYSAYLYLGPLEDEIFSPLIAGFYTDEFVKELDRRYRLTSSKGLVEGCGLARLDAESFIGWMSNSWGQPRRSWSHRSLGPMDAWHYGGH